MITSSATVSRSGGGNTSDQKYQLDSSVQSPQENISDIWTVRDSQSSPSSVEFDCAPRPFRYENHHVIKQCNPIHHKTISKAHIDVRRASETLKFEIHHELEA